MSRESRVKKAKLAEQAERYEDMVQEMNEVVAAGTWFFVLFCVGLNVPILFPPPRDARAPPSIPSISKAFSPVTRRS